MYLIKPGVALHFTCSTGEEAKGVVECPNCGPCQQIMNRTCLFQEATLHGPPQGTLLLWRLWRAVRGAVWVIMPEYSG